MPQITQVGRVLVPVSDQDAAIGFYTEKLGFSLVADVAFGEGSRWVEVALPGGGTTLSLVPPQGDYKPGRMTGIALATADARGDHAELQRQGVDVDPALMGGDGTVPAMFFLRDGDGNQMMVVESS